MPKTSSKTSENPDFGSLFRVFFAETREFSPSSRENRGFFRWPSLDSYLLVTGFEAHQVAARR
jgi:hypothetical protein